MWRSMGTSPAHPLANRTLSELQKSVRADRVTALVAAYNEQFSSDDVLSLMVVPRSFLFY